MRRILDFHFHRCLVFLFFCSVFSFKAAWSQQATIDSVLTILLQPTDSLQRQELIQRMAQVVTPLQADSAMLMLETEMKQSQFGDTNANQKKLILEVVTEVGKSLSRVHQYPKAIVWWKKVIQLSESNDKQRAYLGYYEASKAFLRTGQSDSSNHYLKNALALAEKQNFKEKQAEALIGLGLNARIGKSYPEAIDYFKQALTIFTDLNNSIGIAEANIQLGGAYYLKGDFPTSLDHTLAGYQIIEDQDNSRLQFFALDLLSDIYEIIEDEENLTLVLEKLFTSLKQEDEDQTWAYLPLIEGRLAASKKDFPKALDLFRESAQRSENEGGWMLYQHYWRFGKIFEALGQIDSALHYYQAIYWKPLIEYSPQPKIRCLQSIGNLQLANNNITEAANAYKEAYELSVKTNSTTPKIEAAEALYQINKQQGNQASALKYLEEATTIKDSLFNEESIRTMARLQADFEFEKEKQSLILQQEQESLKQRNIRSLLIIGLAALGILLLIGFFFLRITRRNNTKLNEQKNIIEQQKAALEELDEAKSRFFTNISHEFRTPLTIISGMMDQIVKRPELWLERGSTMIKQNTNALLDLVNQILDLRKLEANEMAINWVHGDVVAYLQYISESYSNFADTKDLQLHFLPNPSKILMDFDAEKMIRIVSNLLSNAVKYTAEGGNIYFHISEITDQQQNKLELRIQDTGVGIPEAELPHIFNRFFQVDDSLTRRGEGTGIGLALTHELVQLLGGSIQVSSELGVGTSFTILLPITRNAEVSLAIPHSGTATTSSTAKSLPKVVIPVLANANKPSLLIVEDNSDVQQYLVACLQDQYQLLLAANGQIGIDMAIEKVPDLIISDVMMPEKNGFELCETLKQDQRTSHIPIILLTAKADATSKISGLKKGADAYLSKPFVQEELEVRLEKLLELRRSLQDRFATYDPVSPPPVNEEVQLEDEFIQRAHQIVTEHMDDDRFSTTSLTEKLHMSRGQVHNKIKALTGKSTSHFIRGIRLEKAKELLTTSQLNVSEIAYEVGFKNHAYFTRIFAEVFKISPSAFRENLKQ